MGIFARDVSTVAIRLPTAAFLLWLLHRRFVARHPMPGFVRIPVKVAVFIVTLGLLSACSNPDPLAVASGPLYALNQGHWHPTPQDLATPPPIMHN